MTYLDQARLQLMHPYWNAANYLTVEQIYVHLNRLITEHDVNLIYLEGPEHSGPAVLANVYLEGIYSEVYPHIGQDAEGMRLLFRQFSTPGGVPSLVSVPTPGSILEGGELGYVLVHAFGAAFDNPDLIVAAVIGDGEAETGPLEGSWKSLDFLNPVRDGAVLPILHLNGYKISGPTVLERQSNKRLTGLLSGHGYDVHFVEGDEPMVVHQALAETLDTCYEKIRSYQVDAWSHGFTKRPRWPAIVLRTPKGWTGPKEFGRYFRSIVPSPLLRTPSDENAGDLVHQIRSKDAGAQRLLVRAQIDRFPLPSSASSRQKDPL